MTSFLEVVKAVHLVQIDKMKATGASTQFAAPRVIGFPHLRAAASAIKTHKALMEPPHAFAVAKGIAVFGRN